MAAITSAALVVAGGTYQAIQGAKQKRDAQNALNNLPIPNLQNAYEGMQVSQLGNQLVSEQSQNRFATNVDALRSGGIRGIIGGLGDVNAQAKQTDLQIKADYDKQENDIAMSQAQDEASIRAMKEQRYQGNVAALSSQYSAGQASQMQGIKGAMQGVVSGAQMYGAANDSQTNQDAYNAWVKAGSKGTYQGPNSSVIQKKPLFDSQTGLPIQ